jgi:hypothetical protein
MKKQTAIEWLVQYIHSEEYQKAFGQTYISIELVEQAKAMEKEQIVDAYDNGAEEWTPIEYSDGQHYYNHNFES